MISSALYSALISETAQHQVSENPTSRKRLACYFFVQNQTYFQNPSSTYFVSYASEAFLSPVGEYHYNITENKASIYSKEDDWDDLGYSFSENERSKRENERSLCEKERSKREKERSLCEKERSKRGKERSKREKERSLCEKERSKRGKERSSGELQTDICKIDIRKIEISETNFIRNYSELCVGKHYEDFIFTKLNHVSLKSNP